MRITKELAKQLASEGPFDGAISLCEFVSRKHQQELTIAQGARLMAMIEKIVAPVTKADFADVYEAKKLTREQLREIKRMTYYRACLMREEGKWSEKEEVAFVNGAMCAFFACQSATEIPAFWIMSPKRLLASLARFKHEGQPLV